MLENPNEQNDKSSSENNDSKTTTPKKMGYPFNEVRSPTSSKNFHARLVGNESPYKNFYTDTFTRCPPNSEKPIGDIAGESGSEEIQTLFKNIEQAHRNYTPKYEQFSGNFLNKIRQLSKHSAIEDIAHRTNLRDNSLIADLNQKLESLKSSRDDLIKIQNAELDNLRRMYTKDDKGNFIEFRDKDNNVIIDAADTQKIFQKAEYELKVAHANQRAVFENYYNNTIENIYNLARNAEQNADVMRMHNVVYKKNKQLRRDEGYHMSAEGIHDMDDFQFHAVNEYQRLFKENAASPNGYSVNIKIDELQEFGQAKINKLKSKLSKLVGAEDSQDFIINITHDKKEDKYTARCYLNAHWDSETCLIALKAFVTECHSHNLKNFSGILENENLSDAHKVELIKFIRQKYGSEAKILGENQVLSKACEPRSRKDRIINNFYNAFSDTQSLGDIKPFNDTAANAKSVMISPNLNHALHEYKQQHNKPSDRIPPEILQDPKELKEFLQAKKYDDLRDEYLSHENLLGFNRGHIGPRSTSGLSLASKLEVTDPKNVELPKCATELEEANGLKAIPVSKGRPGPRSPNPVAQNGMLEARLVNNSQGPEFENPKENDKSPGP